MSTPESLSTEELEALRELLGQVGSRPWFLSDCEGRLEIWRESVLKHVTRDEDGDIDGYGTPGSYRRNDLVAQWDLDTWDEGEDEDDDERRRMAGVIVDGFNALPGLLAETDTRLSIEDVERFLKRERDEYEPRGECWNTVDDVLDAFLLHMVTGTPLTEPRPSGGPEDLSVGTAPLIEAEELRAEVKRLRRVMTSAFEDMERCKTSDAEQTLREALYIEAVDG